MGIYISILGLITFILLAVFNTVGPAVFLTISIFLVLCVWLLQSMRAKPMTKDNHTLQSLQQLLINMQLGDDPAFRDHFRSLAATVPISKIV
jgi:Flp pilus assembly protein TadB